MNIVAHFYQLHVKLHSFPVILHRIRCHLLCRTINKTTGLARLKANIFDTVLRFSMANLVAIAVPHAHLKDRRTVVVIVVRLEACILLNCPWVQWYPCSR